MDRKELIEALRDAANEAVTNGEWTDGEQRGDWRISKEVYEMLQEAVEMYDAAIRAKGA